jgi:hypothetical protein
LRSYEITMTSLIVLNCTHFLLKKKKKKITLISLHNKVVKFLKENLYIIKNMKGGQCNF